MTEYKVGSIGNLISANSDSVIGPTIVFKSVTSKPRKDREVNPSSGEKLNPKKRVTFDTSVSSSKNAKRKKVKLNDAPLLNREEEEAQSQVNETFSQNAKRRVHLKVNTHKHVDDPDRGSRTVFVGNIPYAHAKKKKLLKFFSKYGEVESVRIRCAPLKDPRMSKKVAVIRNEFHPERSSICAYVVFRTHQGAETTAEANGTVYHDHHLRIDLAANASKKQSDSKQSVFIGNLPFAAEEEDLWKLFSECGTIESVRIIRDAITAVSKGVAFVNFQSQDAAELALQMDRTTLKKRNISVSRLRPSAKPSLDKSTPEKVVRHKLLDEASRSKISRKEEIRMYKKAKRKMRKEGESLLGLSKKTEGNNGNAENVEQKKTKLGKNRKKHIKFGEDTPEDTTGNQSEVRNLKKSGPKHIKIDDETIQDSEQNEMKSGMNKSKHLRFQGQTIEESKNKKKKKNKGDLKKKKTAALLLGGGGLQKKKGQKI